MLLLSAASVDVIDLTSPVYDCISCLQSYLHSITFFIFFFCMVFLGGRVRGQSEETGNRFRDCAEGKPSY